MSAAEMSNMRPTNLTSDQQDQVRNLINEKAISNNGHTIRANIKALTPEQRAIVVLAFTGTIPNGFKLEGEVDKIIESMKSKLENKPGLQRKKSAVDLTKSAAKKVQDIFGMQGRIKVSDVQVAIHGSQLDKTDELAKGIKGLLPTEGQPQKIIDSNKKAIIGLFLKINNQNSEKLCKSLLMNLSDEEIKQLAMILKEGKIQSTALEMIEGLEDTNNRDRVCKSLIDVLSPAEAGDLIKKLLGDAIRKQGFSNPGALLRGITGGNSLLKAFTAKYLNQTVEKYMSEALTNTPNEHFEIPGHEKEVVALSTKFLSLLEEISNEDSEHMQIFRDICAHVKNVANPYHGDKSGMHATNLLVLRLVNPLLVSPGTYTENRLILSKDQQSNVKLVSSLLQKLANDMKFKDKGEDDPFNTFLDNNREVMQQIRSNMTENLPGTNKAEASSWAEKLAALKAKLEARPRPARDKNENIDLENLKAKLDARRAGKTEKLKSSNKKSDLTQSQ